jgi:ankyrin repeat protein
MSNTLIEFGDPLNVDMNFIGFSQAVINEQVEAVRSALAEGSADPGTLDNWAIRLVCDSNKIELAELLLNDARVDPTAKRNSAILNSACKGTTEVMKLLLKDGRADPCAEDHQAIRSAAVCGHSEIVALLLRDGRTEPAAQGNAALYYAAQDGLDDVVELLLADERVVAGEGVGAALQEANKRHITTGKLFVGIYDPQASPPILDLGALSLMRVEPLATPRQTFTEGQRRVLGMLKKSPW